MLNGLKTAQRQRLNNHQLLSVSSQRFIAVSTDSARRVRLRSLDPFGEWPVLPEYASPALRTDLSGPPPTISWVGTMEPFKDETIAYIDALEAAGVPTKFKLFEGGFHGFEILAPKVGVSIEAIEFQGSAFAEYYDRYL